MNRPWGPPREWGRPEPNKIEKQFIKLIFNHNRVAWRSWFTAKIINQASDFGDEIAKVVNVFVNDFQFLLQFDASVAEVFQIVTCHVQLVFVFGHTIQKTTHSISHVDCRGELVFMIDQKTWRKAVEPDQAFPKGGTHMVGG